MEKMKEMPDDEKLMKTGTTGLAFKYKDGIIMIADKQGSTMYAAGKKEEKIFMLSKTVGMVISGLVSDAQNLVEVMKAELKLYKFDNAIDPTVKVASSLLSAILHSAYRRYFPYFVGNLIVGGVDISGIHLFTVGTDGSLVTDDYLVTGSGSLFALSKLEDSWKEGMNKEEAKQLAIQALKLAISRDLYTGEGYNLFFITEDGHEKESITLKQVEV
ncbi:MAG: proteasome subunit beta [Candidatus Hodarchaeales archaeon]|jgi:proteasome beta subunit